MAFKIVIFFAALAAVNAGIIETGWQQPQHGWQQPQHGWQPQTTIIKPATIVKKIVHAEHEAPAHYEFNYEVHDQHTGDIKRQSEKAENGQISGQYSLVDPDGYRRVVTYTADDHHGFQANVQREPWNEGHKVVAHSHPVVTKVIQPATITKVIQPVHTVQKVISAPSHGWQQPQQAWQPAPQHGWQANPHSNPWG